MNSQGKNYLNKNKNNNAVKENASGWVLTTSFGASVISGMLIGLLIEYFIDISPYGVIGGIILGCFSGYYKLWIYSRKLTDES